VRISVRSWPDRTVTGSSYFTSLDGFDIQVLIIKDILYIQEWIVLFDSLDMVSGNSEGVPIGPPYG